MLLRARTVVDRLWHRATRAAELRDVRLLLVAEPGPAGLDPAERQLCVEMRGLRAEISGMLGAVGACARCAREAAHAEGPWPGGHCCGGQTAILFDPVELAALRGAGTRPGHLVAPRSEHFGCCFRGPRGCSLRPAHRPNRCVWYHCPALQRELHGLGLLDEVEAASHRLSALYDAYSRLRAERLELEFATELAHHAGLRLPPE